MGRIRYLLGAAIAALVVSGAGAAELTSGYLARHWGGDVPAHVAAGGLGLELATPLEHVRVGTGLYQNSFGRASAYAGVAWRPLVVGPVAAGLLLGAATGYERAAVVPMAGISVDMAMGGWWRLHLVAMPAVRDWPNVLAVQVKVGF